MSFHYSGVATLSCTDSSTASSDASDPGSPYSPSSCDDHQTTGPTNVLQLQQLHQHNARPQQQHHQQKQYLTPGPPHNWPWSSNFGSTTGAITITTAPIPSTASQMTNFNKTTTTIATITATATVNNKSKRTLSLPTDAPSVAMKKVRASLDRPLALVAAAPKKSTYTKQRATLNFDEHLVGGGNLTCGIVATPASPQTKITGFFKSQMKPLNGLKRDLTNLVVRSTDFPKSAKHFTTTHEAPVIAKELCDLQVRTALTANVVPALKKVERKTAKVAPLVPISRKPTVNAAIAKKSSMAIISAANVAPKKPVSIAPRSQLDSGSISAPKRSCLPPQLMPKLQEIQQPQQSTVLLAAIRMPPQQQVVAPMQQPAKIQHQQQQPAQQQKVAPLFQLHSAPVMPKLVQIPNILTKDSNNLMMTNHPQLTRISTASQHPPVTNGHYFLNGALIKFQQTGNQNGTTPGISTNALPFTSKSLPLQQHLQTHHHQQQQQQQHSHHHQQQPQIQMQQQYATSQGQYAAHQSVFMATSSGLILSTALPSAITSQLSGMQTINQHQSTMMPALHQYGQPNGTMLPNIHTILQNGQNGRQTATYVSSAPAVTHYHHLQSQQPPALCATSSNPNLPSKIPNPPPQIFFTSSMPSLITTSTPTTSITSSCISPREAIKPTTGHLHQSSPPPLIISPVTSLYSQKNPPPLVSASSPIIPQQTQPYQQQSSMTTLTMHQSQPPALVATGPAPPALKITIPTPQPVVVVQPSKPTVLTTLKSTQLLPPPLTPTTIHTISLTTALKVDTVQPIMPISKPPAKLLQPINHADPLRSPTVPLLSPAHKSPVPIPCLPSPKSLVLEKIQREKFVHNDPLTTPRFTALRPVATIDTDIHNTASLPECAKSPILSQPKTIRFPAAGGSRGGVRRSDGRIVGVCYWDKCDDKYDTSSKLLDHLQTQHVNSQSGPFMCQWSGCKVHSRVSCSRRWLERHVLSHGGTKPFKCIVDGCGLRFGSQVSQMLQSVLVSGNFVC